MLANDFVLQKDMYFYKTPPNIYLLPSPLSPYRGDTLHIIPLWMETLFTHDCFQMKPTITSIYLENITQKQHACFVYNINSCPPKPDSISNLFYKMPTTSLSVLEHRRENVMVANKQSRILPLEL